MSEQNLTDLFIERQRSGDQHRTLGDPTVIRRRESLLFTPHVRSLNELVQRWNTEDRAIPWFDPVEGGVHAEILILLQSPGPMANREKGSGFISPDNNDMSAQRMWEAYRDVGISRDKIISWNIVPWYIGLQSPTTKELQNGGQYLRAIFDLLPRLQSVVLVGEKAHVAWNRYVNGDVDEKRFFVAKCMHPRARTFTKDIEKSLRDALSPLSGGGGFLQEENSLKAKRNVEKPILGYQSFLPNSTIAVWQQVFERQKAFGEHAFNQLSDEQFFAVLAPGLNSCAVIANHLAGNLRSRWTDLLTTDGEKPDRDRDAEFDPPVEHTTAERAKIMQRWENGWAVLFATLDGLKPGDLSKIVTIRGVDHPVHAAVARQLDHYSFHIGQINIIARQLVGTDSWRWFTLPPGGTKAFNKKWIGE